MNERAIGILDNYDMEVTRTAKGRGSIICETNRGCLVLKEYRGSTDKLELLDRLQQNMRGTVHTDNLVRNKENQLYCKDTDGTVYILKEHIEGRECSYKSEEDVKQAFTLMAKLHLAMTNVGANMECELPIRNLYMEEMEKHTRECRHIRNYLRRPGSKTGFERELMNQYDYYLDKAEEITGLAQEEDISHYIQRIEEGGFFYHGDYQYHNVILNKNDISVINFEHFGRDSGVRDLYLLYRKISEKSGWNVSLGSRMLEAYERIRPLMDWEKRQLACRLAYPDKFWKIANYYYNTRKTCISDKQAEKLEILNSQEQARQRLIHALFSV